MKRQIKLCFSESKAFMMANLILNGWEKEVSFHADATVADSSGQGALRHGPLTQKHKHSFPHYQDLRQPRIVCQKANRFRECSHDFLFGSFVLLCQGKVDKSHCHQYIFVISSLKCFSCHFSYSFSTTAFRAKQNIFLKSHKKVGLGEPQMQI